MRAERLLQIILRLQRHELTTAAELAASLAVTTRTIYRDMDTLSLLGIPIYAEAGRYGGYQILDSYRDSLSGLTQGEISALLAVGIPGPLEKTSLEGPLATAFLKLQSLLSIRATDPMDRILVAPASGEVTDPGGAQLPVLLDSVARDRELKISYRLALNPEEVTVLAHPYGLVADGLDWTLVFATSSRIRTVLVRQLTAAHPTGNSFERDAEFSLRTYWSAISREIEWRHHAYAVQLEIPRLLKDTILRVLAGGTTAVHGLPPLQSPIDWQPLEVGFGSLEQARDRLLPLGGAVRVVQPMELRISLVDHARQTLLAHGIDELPNHHDTRSGP